MVSSSACSSIFLNWSASARLPRASTTSPISSSHSDGPFLGPNSRVQLLRASGRRSSHTAGVSTTMVGTAIWCASSGIGRSTKISSRTVARLGCLAQSVLPMVMSRADSRGHGTSVCQPFSPSPWRQVTVRSPLMAKGRPMASETRSLSQGLRRFQSKVRIKTTSSAISATGVSTLHRTTLRRTGMRRALLSGGGQGRGRPRQRGAANGPLHVYCIVARFPLLSGIG
ncbi:hypothetical protein D9M72_263310 [compost metagenome]